MQINLIETWDKVLEGNHQAWAKLINRYTGLIMTVACRIGLTSIDAEDCAQFTWTALYNHRFKIKDPEALPLWLILTTRRRAIRVLQKIRKNDQVLLEFDIEDASLTPDEALLELELQDNMEQALNQLDPKCRLLIKELFLTPDRKSYSKISKILKIAPNSLGPLRSRCLKKLSEILKKNGYLED